MKKNMYTNTVSNLKLGDEKKKALLAALEKRNVFSDEPRRAETAADKNGNGKSPRRRRRLLLTIGAIAAGIMLIAGAVFGTLSITGGIGGNTVPVYQGMSVLSKSEVTPSAYVRGNHDSKAIGDSDESGGITVDETSQNDIDYFAEKGEDIIVCVNIYNPDSLAILRFTFNGRPYQSYQFMDGSDSERIYLEVNVGQECGIVEYTIDEIKYVDDKDNNAIKDVRMDGDKTIKVGVTYDSLPSSSVTLGEITPTAANLSIRTNDAYGLIINAVLPLTISLNEDQQSLIDQKSLSVGTNQIEFADLTAGKEYEYRVTAGFDALDGRGKRTFVLAEGSFKTPLHIEFGRVTATQDSVSFDLTTLFGGGRPTAVLAIDEKGETVCTADGSARMLDGLLSGKTYTLKVIYAYGDKECSVKTVFTTATKIAPALSVVNIETDSDRIVFDVTAVDPDGICKIIKRELYAESVFVGNITGYDIGGLLPNTLYTVRITYTYDLNDGKGEQTNFVTADITTDISDVVVDSIEIMNVEETIVLGDQLLLRIYFECADNFEPNGFIIDGVYRAVDTYTGKYAIVKYVPGEGAHPLNIAGVCYTDKSSMSNTVVPRNNYSIAPIFVLGELYAFDFYQSEKYSDFLVASLTLEIDNPYDYDIYSVTIGDWQYSPDTYVDYTDIVKLDSRRYVVSFRVLNYGAQRFVLTKITYGKNGVTASSSKRMTANAYFVRETHEISNTAELQAIEPRPDTFALYLLTADIDLKGINWTTKAINGVIDGNGHTISNLTQVVNDNIADTDVYYGLFKPSSASAFFDLTVKNIYISVNSGAHDVYIGGLVSSLYVTGTIERCNVSGVIDVTTTGSNYNSGVGGLTGYSTGRITDCVAKVNIKLTQPIGYTSACGGFVGRHVAGGRIYNSEAIFNIEGNGIIGGFVGLNDAYIYNSVARGKAVGIDGLGGFVGINNQSNQQSAIIENCSANVEMYATSETAGNVGGFAQYNERGGQIKNCLARGYVEGNNFVGGLIASNSGSVIGCGVSVNIVGVSTIGGLAGTNSGVLKENFAECKITELNVNIKGGNVGGLVGYDSGGNIADCYTQCEIIGFSGAGGLVGSTYNTTIADCYAKGRLEGEMKIGGFVGQPGAIGNIESCFSLCTVGGQEDVDGFSGTYIADIKNCYATSFSDYAKIIEPSEITETFIFDTLGWDRDIWEYVNGEPRLKSLAV